MSVIYSNINDIIMNQNTNEHKNCDDREMTINMFQRFLIPSHNLVDLHNKLTVRSNPCSCRLSLYVLLNDESIVVVDVGAA